MKTLNKLIAAAFIMTGNYMMAQSTGVIRGTITDADGAPLFGAAVKVLEDSTFVTGTTSDFDGNYNIKDITPGNYDVQIEALGKAAQRIQGVIVDPSQVAYISAKLTAATYMLKEAEVVVRPFEKTIINPLYSTMTSIRLDQIEKMPATPGDIIAIAVSVTPGVMPTDDGKDLYVRGSRRGSTQYIIDGNKTMGSPEVPGLGIAGMEVLTGGVPAEYGDCTGGIVIITTKDYKWEMRRKDMERRNREESKKKKSSH
jgi:outer membrane receptor protein involved in Fe transport